MASSAAPATLEDQRAASLAAYQSFLTSVDRAGPRALAFTITLLGVALAAGPLLTRLVSDALTSGEYVATTVVGGVVALAGLLALLTLARAKVELAAEGGSKILASYSAEAAAAHAAAREFTPDPPPGS